MPLASGLLYLNVLLGEISYLEHPCVIETSLSSRVPYDQRFSSCYLALNTKERKRVVSYPLSDFLIERNSGIMWSKHEAKSNYFKNLSSLSNLAISDKGQQENY
ncbi:MAG: hypothetical protein ACJAXX_002095 [Roseivirga sp.]|jgi:hypothetical protein